MKQELTERQSLVYEAIRELMSQRGFPPTVRELMAKCEFKSPNGVCCHLRALEKKGWIEREANVSRGLRLTEATQ